jgi:tyrosinase
MAKKRKDEAAQPQQQTRYQRVQQILDEAQGETCPSYQGYGPFWKLPLEQFLQVTIYGVPMIAPVGAAPSAEGPPPAGDTGTEAHSCCHPANGGLVQMSGGGGNGGGKTSKKRYPGRGAASGLIKGLKGQYPFDGSQFPRLPWAGKQVSGADIQFIQDWIDDGCPGNGEPGPSIEVVTHSRLKRAHGDEDHPLFAGSANQYHHDTSGVKVRKNVAFLTPDELKRFRKAVAVMKSYNAYYQDERSFDYWARIHANNCQHGWEEFLPWHRLYLYHFEQQLQDVDPTVTLPYWDWTMNRKDVDISIQDMSTDKAMDNGVVPEAYRCWIDQEGLDKLKASGLVPEDTLKKLATVLNQKFNSGLRLFQAAGITYTQNKTSDKAIMDELAQINSLWQRLRWPGGNKNLIFEAYPTPEDVQRVLKIENFFQFGSGPTNDHFFGALENIHNLIHNFSGGANPYYDPNTSPQNREEPQYGDMVYPGMTAFDPIFWGHHSNVDRLWAEWQTLHPNVDPDNLTAILPPWTMNVQQTLNIQNFGYEYMKSSHVYPTDNTMHITKFRSAKAGVHPHILANHKRAEVRLHKVQYKVRGGYHIRVFLNLPDANVDTPTRGNDHYVGQFNTFTGFCVGGPGHCDVPPETRRKHDLRPRHHKTPGHFRIDATETVSKLVAKGETDLHVNLVVLNTDGTPASDALSLDAVSLNFMD